MDDLEWQAAVGAAGDISADIERAGWSAPAERRDELRAISPKWWREVEKICTLYCQSGGTRQFPPELAYRLADLAGVIAAGHMPEMVELAQKATTHAGRPGKTEGEIRSIQVAITYCKAARSSGVYNKATNTRIHIEDVDPVGTIVRFYGLRGRSSVSKWLKQKIAPLEFGEQFASAEGLTELLAQHGELYRRFGRSYSRAHDETLQETSPPVRARKAPGM